MKQMWLWLLIAAVFCSVVVVSANAAMSSGWGAVYLDDDGADGGEGGGGQSPELKPAWLCDQPDGGDDDGGQEGGGCE